MMTIQHFTVINVSQYISDDMLLDILYSVLPSGWVSFGNLFPNINFKTHNLVMHVNCVIWHLCSGHNNQTVAVHVNKSFHGHFKDYKLSLKPTPASHVY